MMVTYITTICALVASGATAVAKSKNELASGGHYSNRTLLVITGL
jgi:hypothetical protein